MYFSYYREHKKNKFTFGKWMNIQDNKNVSSRHKVNRIKINLVAFNQLNSFINIFEWFWKTNKQMIIVFDWKFNDRVATLLRGERVGATGRVCGEAFVGGGWRLPPTWNAISIWATHPPPTEPTPQSVRPPLNWKPLNNRTQTDNFFAF